MTRENKLDYITPEERKRWEEADIDIDLYKRLASTICAQPVDEYRDHLKNMRHLAYDLYDYINDPDENTNEYRIKEMYHEFDTERGMAIREEHFMLSERWRIFTDINPVWTMNIVREQEKINDAMWTLTLEDVLRTAEEGNVSVS